MNKLYAGIFSGALLLSIGSATAFANNSSNTSFEWDFQYGTNTDYTPSRAKVDNTSAWVDVQSIGPDTSHAVTASVVNGSNYSNFSKTWYYKLDSSSLNRGIYLSNYAYEDKGVNVPVRIKATRVGSLNAEYYFSGVWSPDSY